MKAAQRVCVLASGGPDSALLILRLAQRYREVYPLYVRCGQVWEKTEVHYLRRFLRHQKDRRIKPLRFAHLPIRGVFGDHWSVTGRGIPGYRASYDSVYLPGRNLMLLSLAFALCERQKIGAAAIGVLKGNPLPDATPSFFRAAQKLLGRTFKARIRVLAPLLKFDKPAVYRALQKGGVPLELTFSCMKPKKLKPCRSCSKCAERDLRIRA